MPAWPADKSHTRAGPVGAAGAVDAQNAPTAPWKTLLVFHELPQGFPHPITHDKPRKSPESYWETRIDPTSSSEVILREYEHDWANTPEAATMYERYHGCSENPFSVTSAPKFLFRSETYVAALERLEDAIQRREGVVVITGDVGTGKTTLCRALL